MEIVEIGCPRSIDLMAIPSIKEKYPDAKSILETVDLYDMVSIRRDIKLQTGIIFISNEEIDNDIKEKMKMIIVLFSKYIGISIRDLIIEIKIDTSKYLRKDEPLLAGLLIALNHFYKNQLTMHELVYLSERIDPILGYYIIGGYKKISEIGKSYNIGDNQFNKYLLLENISTDNKEELERLRNFLSNYNDLNIGIDECYFLAIKGIINPSIPINLKREFPKTIIRTINNTNKHKTLIKYLK